MYLYGSIALVLLMIVVGAVTFSCRKTSSPGQRPVVIRAKEVSPPVSLPRPKKGAVRIVDTSLADGVKTKVGSRILIEDFLPYLQALHSAGVKDFKVMGGARFNSAIRYVESVKGAGTEQRGRFCEDN